MATEKFSTARTNFRFLDRAVLLEFLCNAMFWLLGLLCNTLFFVFVSLASCFSRVDESERNEPSSGSDSRAIESQQDDQIGSCDGKKETLQLGFVFHGGTETSSGFDEDSDENQAETQTETESSVLCAPTAMTSKYEFISGGNISGFVEEPKIMSLMVQEMFVGPTDSTVYGAGADQTEQFCNFEEEEEEEEEDSVLSFSFGSFLETNKKTTFDLVSNEKQQHQVLGFENDELGKLDLSKPDQISSEIDLGVSESLLGQNVTEVSDSENEMILYSKSDPIELIITRIDNSIEPIVTRTDSDEFIELDPHAENPVTDSDEDVVFGETEQMESSEKPENISFHDSDEEDDDMEWDFITEHKDLIEQLKVELKNVRIGGLPTILEEESESPKIAEDLKPLKIDEKKLEHKDTIEQIQKGYKNYAEKMRKLDILNYQTMHAIGFIKRKDQSQFVSVRKTSAMKFTCLHNLMGSRARMVGDDPIGELERELELVYVAQACLSWKILHWQYEKARELSDYDPQGFRMYNEVAGEFQLFQVLIQRYVEDETFRGPRVQNYVKNRCIIRNLLQVPLIRDDKNKKGRREEENAISSAMLSEIIHECMKAFWEFLRADKKGTNVISKGSQHNEVELQNPDDKTLLIEVQMDLQKKERKLKDILRTGNCIVKKFQKHYQQENRLNHALFLSQVELRLVSRVLNMSKLTSQQLVWCQEQIGKINFTNRKVYLEPSFLLFPC